MKYIKVYEEDLDKSIKDLQGLGIIDDVDGWWVRTNSAMNVTYYSIYAVTEKSAANLLLKEILSKEEDVDSFTDLINLYKKNMLRGNGFERMQITVWEMTPRDTIAKERLTKIETLSIPEIHRLGKNLFKNFDQVMEKDPAYTMLNRPMIVDLRGRRSL